MGFDPINERMCKLSIRGKIYNSTLISAYAPTEGANDELKEQFLAELHINLEQSSKHDAVIILDFNAKVGKQLNNRLVAGKYILHNETNDNGITLWQYTEMNDLEINNKIYEHKKINKETWRDLANKIVNQIDIILICKRRVNTIQDVRTLRVPNCDSDHFLVRAIIKQKITTNFEKSKQKQSWDTNRLNSQEIVHKYQENLETQIDKTEVRADINEESTNIKQ